MGEEEVKLPSRCYDHIVGKLRTFHQHKTELGCSTVVVNFPVAGHSAPHHAFEKEGSQFRATGSMSGASWWKGAEEQGSRYSTQGPGLMTHQKYASLSKPCVFLKQVKLMCQDQRSQTNKFSTMARSNSARKN